MDDFTGEVQKVLNNVVDKVKEYGGIAKVQAQIKAEEAKKTEQYYRLGKKYYELYKDAPASDLTEIMNKLLACDKKIEEYREILKEAKEAKYTDVSDVCDAEATEPAEEVEAEVAEEVVEETTEEAE